MRPETSVVATIAAWSMARLKSASCSTEVRSSVDILGFVSTATILIVDDEALLRWSLRERLTTEGYTAQEAGTAQEALEQATDDVDLILLDFKLPDGDGLSVLRQVKGRSPETLVILMTAFSTVENAVEAMKLGAYHYVNKPFNLDEVAMLVEKALETSRLRR